MSPSEQALAQVRAAMAETNAFFNTEVFGKHNSGALDTIYTAAARILPPGTPLIAGRPAKISGKA